MESNCPFSYPSSFTDLLNQTTASPTPPFCTQTPPFSSQTRYTGGAEDGGRVGDNLPAASREGRRRWTVSEDGALLSAWLNTSKDAVVGNDQKGCTFWKRVATYYNAIESVKDFPHREWNTCKQRFGKINEPVQKFCGCYEQAGRQRTSGQSEDDVFEMAHKFYFQDQRCNFTLDHAWRMLRNEQKWCNLSKGKGNKSGKPTKLSEAKRSQPEASGGGSPMEEQAEERPIGVKAAKAAKLKGNKSGKPTNEDREASLKNLQTIVEIRERENVVKEKLADKKLLASLLGRTEALTEMEIELKNKLISGML